MESSDAHFHGHSIEKRFERNTISTENNKHGLIDEDIWGGKGTVNNLDVKWT